MTLGHYGASGLGKRLDMVADAQNRREKCGEPHRDTERCESFSEIDSRDEEPNQKRCCAPKCGKRVEWQSFVAPNRQKPATAIRHTAHGNHPWLALRSDASLEKHICSIRQEHPNQQDDKHRSHHSKLRSARARNQAPTVLVLYEKRQHKIIERLAA